MIYGSVYKIWNDVDDKFYIGSSKLNLSKRISDHKSNSRTQSRRAYNCKFYKHMRLHGQDKFHIECLENVECEDLKALHAKEQEYIDELKPELNYQRASRSHMTKKEIYKEGNDKAIANRTPEQIEHHKQRVKNWHTANKEKVKKYKAELFQKQKAALQEKRRLSPKITCGCGSVIKECRNSEHIKSLKHKNWLALQE